MNALLATVAPLEFDLIIVAYGCFFSGSFGNLFAPRQFASISVGEMKISLTKMHGSSNDILIAPKSLADIFGDDKVLADEFIVNLCDRTGPLGADGIYFLDLGSTPIKAEFYNPDGSFAGMCGNGLRAVTRLVLERSSHSLEKLDIISDGFNFVGQRSEAFDGVETTCVSTKSVSFEAESLPIVTDKKEFLEAKIPESGTDLEFSAVSIPNDHIVAVTDNFDQELFEHLGEKLSIPNSVLPNGANVSIMVPISDDEFFVRTFERGAGPTAACGSGLTAARAVLSKLGIVNGLSPKLLRNIGGPAKLSLGTDDKGQWFGLLDGNATYVYDVEVDPHVPLTEQSIEVLVNNEDKAAFESLYQQNKHAIELAGIEADYTPADVGRA